MSSVSTGFKVHHNQKLGDHPAVLGECTMAFGGIDASVSGGKRLSLVSVSAIYVSCPIPIFGQIVQVTVRSVNGF